MRLNKTDLFKMLKAFGWALSASIVAGIIAVLTDPGASDLPMWLVPLVPAVNVFLYGVSRFIMDNRK